MTLTKLAAELKRASRFSATKRVLPALWLLSDSQRLSNPRAALGRLPTGSGFIFRNYDQPGREFMARELLRVCRQRRIIFLLAGDWRMALRVGADGAHFPEALAHQAHAVRSTKPNAIVTVAAHSARGILRARQSGADAVLLSPVFVTQSHPEATPLGPGRFAKLTCEARLPVIALGGIDLQTARRLKGGGAAGIAGISGIV
ncbi:MAG: thiamine phosphate synthase [Alphaproteobacteria bacterium]|nr:thiamine phosphate synthase [Alphaproteobacteria bacterium]